VVHGVRLDGSNVSRRNIAERRADNIADARPDTTEASLAVTEGAPVCTCVTFETPVRPDVE
jgi:hypothetical protein